ncbi:hypothetical protein [Neobacillus sp. D3-1R]|uniref:hypothetical protein n=1 Tax=Neobacillus sp. D3-1R TaxID=3445778 RepID=UPI003FA137C4
MKYFSPGNLLVGALLKTKLQKIYPRLVDNKLQIAIAYLKPKQYLSNNVGIASLQKSKLSKREDFVAFNNLNSRQDVNKTDRLTLRKFNLTICLNDQVTLPVKRLGVNNLEIYVPETLGFAKKRQIVLKEKYSQR